VTEYTPPPNLEGIYDPSDPSYVNPALARCCLAHAEAHLLEWEKGDRCRMTYPSSECGRAFRSALPPLLGPQNIRDFVACVAHGMAINAIDEARGTKLLYAAQVAFNTSRSQPKPKAPKNMTPPPSDS
jgi:hypothetical protein